MSRSIRCKCIEKVNKELAKKNLRLATNLSFNIRTGEAYLELPVPLQKIEPSRKPLPTFVATFCVFCGKRLIPKDKPKRKKTRATP